MKKVLGLVAVIALLFGCERVKETTVSGTVRNGEIPVQGAIVLLLESATLDTGLSLDAVVGLISLPTGGDGGYEIIRVEPGTYYVTAIKDEDENLAYSSGDRYGWYGERDTLPDGTIFTKPEQITVEEKDLLGINIDTLFIAP